MTINLTALQKQRRDTAANWTGANPTLLAGEIGIESDTNKIKIGTGSTAWTSLSYTTWSQISAYPIVNADVASAAAIAGTKISPNFGAQSVITTGSGLFGTATSLSTSYSGAGNFQVASNSATAIQTYAFNSTAVNYPATLELARARNTQASPAIVVNGDYMGEINFYGYNTNFQRGAVIYALVDGEPGTAGDTSDMPGKLIFATSANGSATPTTRLTIDSAGLVTIPGDLTVNGTTTTINSTTLVVQDKNIEMGAVTVPTDVTADGGGITLKGTTDKTINWIDSTDAWTFSEHVNIVSAKEYRIAGTKVLDATSLGSAVVGSSLTSVGTISSGTWNGTAIADTYLATISTALKVSNSATTATSANTASAIVARDASGNFTAGTITATLTGNASTVTTNANLTGDVTSVGNATSIAAGVIVDADINASAAIVDTKLATISTAGKVSNSATTATDVNTASAIVARDASGNFTAGTITAALTGAASSNVLKAGDTMTGALVVPLASASTPSLTFTGDLDTGVFSPGANQVAISTNGSQRLLINSGGITSANGGVFQGDVSSYATDGLALTFNSANSEIRACRSGGNYTNMLFYTQGANSSGVQQERMRLTSEGLLGLGTSSPSTTLDVRGSAQISGPSLNFSCIGDNTVFNVKSASNTLSYLGPRASSGVGLQKGYFTLYDTGVDKIVLDSAGSSYFNGGNVGIGTTAPSQLFEIKGANARLAVNSTTVADGGILLQGNGTTYAEIKLDASSGILDIAEKQAAGNITFSTGTTPTERVRVDSSGRLLVGTSSAAGVDNVTLPAILVSSISSAAGGRGIQCVHYGGTTDSASSFIGLRRSRGTAVDTYTLVQNGDALGGHLFYGSDGSGWVVAASIAASVDGTPGANDMPGRLVFSTTADGAASPTERMRINSGGFLKATNDATYVSTAAASFHEFRSDRADWALGITNKNASPSGIFIGHNTDINNTGNLFLGCYGGASYGTVRAEIRANGGLANYSANNANLSDRNAKQDISPAADTWDCIKEWEIVNYRYKDQLDDADLNLGVIAQQVAESCPEVITIFQEAKDATEDKPAQEERLGVKEQQMMWMAIKALQEAMERIEVLEAEVAALKGA